MIEARGPSPEAQAALGELCEAYYEAVFGFIRRSAPENDARDLTQEFFRRMLAGPGFTTADPQRGRFRSFLLGAVKHFLADVHDHAHRLKRGGGQAHLPLDAETDTSIGLQVPDLQAAAPDREFDRKWALTLLNRVLMELTAEHSDSDKADQFEVFKPFLTGDHEAVSQAEAARQAGMTEGAAKVAIHRLRRRFRELIKREIQQTLADPSEASDELAVLLDALSG